MAKDQGGAGRHSVHSRFGGRLLAKLREAIMASKFTEEISAARFGAVVLIEVISLGIA